MAGMQHQSEHTHPQSVPKKQHETTNTTFGKGKHFWGTPEDAADPTEDWCDSGVESFSGCALSVDVPCGVGGEFPQTRTPQDSFLTHSPSETGSEHGPELGSCVSVGERLDSALGDSITDEMLGDLSQGIGTMDLGEGGESGTVRVQVKTSPAVNRQVTQEMLNTLNFVSEDGDTALHLALIHEQWGFVQYLLEVISLDHTWIQYLDVQNHLGQTALHLAVIVDQPVCVRGLLQGGACPDLQDRSGNTPLHLAVREGRVACVWELTSHPPRSEHLHMTNYAGVGALHLAVQKGNEVVVRMLLDAGADANLRDLGSGRTPLHWAVESQNPGVVRLLLNGGAAVNQPSYAGHSPLYCAHYRPNKEVQILLQERGAVVEEVEEEEDEEERESGEEEFDDLVINGLRVM